jgi:hypothetical protein
MQLSATSGARRRWTRATVTAAIMAALMLPALPAAAIDGAGPTRASDAGSYCAYNSDTGVIACVDDEQDYQEAKRAAGVATDLVVTHRRSVASQYLLGRFYDDELYLTTHGYLDWFASAPCTASTADINSSWVDTTSWRSRISSFRGYSNCRIKAWQYTGYSGASLGFTSGSYNVGSLNDHVWSVRFT